jgi:hypothetical protein
MLLLLLVLFKGLSFFLFSLVIPRPAAFPLNSPWWCSSSGPSRMASMDGECWNLRAMSRRMLQIGSQFYA